MPASLARDPAAAAAPGARPLLPRVAYVMSRFPKVTETFVLFEMLALEAQGVAVEIFPLLRERQKVAHPEAAALVARAHFHPFLSWPILRANLHFLRRAPRAYLRVLGEVLRGTWGSANFFVGALGTFPKAVRFALEMQALGVTHLHAHFATHPTVAALVVHRLTGIPFSFTAHGSDLHVERRMLDRKLAAAAFAVTISAYNREVMVRECGEWARDKIHVVHCGVDPEVFVPRPEPEEACIQHQEARTAGPFRILCVASFEEVKGHRYLIEACRILRQRGVALRCDLVGTGPLAGAAAALVARHGLRNEVHLHGVRPRQEISRLMAASDAFCLPSVPTRQGKREGIPVVLMEAMASGLPVVSSRLSGIPELVEDRVAGLLVTPRDAAALADALQKLSRDAALRRRMGCRGRQIVEEHFNLYANARRLAQLFARNGEPRCST